MDITEYNFGRWGDERSQKNNEVNEKCFFFQTFSAQFSHRRSF